MNMPFRSMAALLVVWALLCTPQRAEAQELERGARLARALAVLDSTETERGAQLLRELIASMPPGAPAALRARAHLHLAATSLSLRLLDSAAFHFAEMVRANPFAVPDPELFNPEVNSAFRAARRVTNTIGLRVNPDTVVKPLAGGYLVAVAVGRPGSVRVRMAGTSGGTGDTVGTVLDVDSVASLVLPLRSADSVTLRPGGYQLTARMLGWADSAVVSLSVARQAVDTVALEAPLDSSLFRPEDRQGPPARLSAVAGVLLGGAAAVLPAVLANKDLGTGTSQVVAASVGAGISVAGVIGAFVGRPRLPIAENIQYNRSLVTGRETRNRATAEANATAIQSAPLRIRMVTP